MAKRCPVGTKRIDNRCEETIDVHLEMTKLEWEVINQALGAPIKQELQSGIKALGIGASDSEISDAWNSATEKWSGTWR